MKPSKAVPFTGEAVVCGKVDSLLSETFLLTIESGMVTSVERLSRAPDLPANSIGHATRRLWQQVREATPLAKYLDNQAKLKVQP